MTEGLDIITRHTFTKERQTQAMSELLYHQPNQPSSKIMLRVIFIRLKAKAEELLAGEQEGFSAVEQIFSKNGNTQMSSTTKFLMTHET